jgi:SPP1 family predicted phage head-tail adaptor
MTMSTKLAAGKLRHQIDLVAPSTLRDASGGTDASSNTIVATVFASIEAITGRDQLAVGEFATVTTHKITIRYFPGVTSRMQVWFSGRTFLINAVLNPDERTKMLVLLASEINDSANNPSGSGQELS